MSATRSAPSSTSTKCTPANKKRTERHVRAARTLNAPPVSLCASLMDAHGGACGRGHAVSCHGERSGKSRRSRFSAPGEQAGGIRRLHYLPDVSRGHLQRLPEEPSPTGGNR